MVYTMVRCRTEEYAVDWSVVERFSRNYWRTYYQNGYSNTVKMSESSWYNPFSWKMPEVATLEVPWDTVNSWTDSAVQSDMATYKARAPSDMRGVAYDIQYKMEQVTVEKSKFRNRLRDVERQNYLAMEAASESYAGIVEWTRFVRDSSADVVMLGSTVLTGGAAAFLLAGGAAMKGGFKYQDTGSAGAALLYGVGSAALGVFKISGKALTAGGEMVLIAANGSLETAVGYVSGDSFSKALYSGTLKVASQGVAQLVFGNSVAKSLFARMVLPMRITVADPEAMKAGVKLMVDRAEDVALRVTKKMTENTLKFAGKQLAKPEAPGILAANGVGLVDDVPFEDRLLLYLAIVNMEKGIGRGW